MEHTKTIVMHADPGHAWAEITKQELVDLRLHEMVSPYSYEKDDKVYLEEDCDLGLLVAAYKVLGIGIEWVEIYSRSDSPVRSYPKYKSHIEWRKHSDNFYKNFVYKTKPEGVSLQ